MLPVGGKIVIKGLYFCDRCQMSTRWVHHCGKVFRCVRCGARVEVSDKLLDNISFSDPSDRLRYEYSQEEMNE